MRSSWNFSTAILEIWVLVLTKPGWANETPTTSLRVPREYANYHQQNHHSHHPQYHQHHNHQHSHDHYGLASNTGEFSSNLFLRNSKHSHHHHFHHQPYTSSSSYYSSSSSYNKNNHYYDFGSSKPQNNYHHQNYHQEFTSSESDSHPSAAVVASALSASSSLLSAYAAAASAPHRCYVCLPPNKNSREAQQILAIFASELRSLIPDCTQFDPYVDAGRFEFDCPPKYGGCILRIHGANVSRACSKYRVNDCKKANSVEFCYCTTPLCNDKKPEPPVIPAVIHHQYQGNSGSRSRSRNSKSSSSVLLRGDEQDGNSSPQGIKSRVSEDDEDNPSEDDDDNDENGGSGAGSDNDDGSNEHLSHRQNPFIDPFRGTTMDPTIFQEENSFAVVVEDPNPHTKIGISMTASTSGATSISLTSSNSPISTLLHDSFWCYWWWSTKWLSSSSPPNSETYSESSIFHHLFHHLHHAVFVRLFDEDVVAHKQPKQSCELSEIDTSSGSCNNKGVIDLSRSCSSHYNHHCLCRESQVVLVGEEKEMHKWGNTSPHFSPEATSSFVYSSLWCFLSGQLCFIISILLVLPQVLLS